MSDLSPANGLQPLQSLFDIQESPLQLLPELEAWYGGGLALPTAADASPGIYSNFVTSLDGRITFDDPGHYGGGDISFRNPDDRRLMALLRSAADAILVGAGTLRVEPKHLWTPEALFPNDPATAALFTRQRAAFGLPARYRHFFVTGSGELTGRPRALDAPEAEIWFVTTPAGKRALEAQFPDNPPNTVVAGPDERVDMEAAMRHLRAEFGVERLLCEGGPTLIGSLIERRLLHSAFLSTAPQIIGNASGAKGRDRPTWVSRYHGTVGTTPTAKLLSLKLDHGHQMQFSHYALHYR
jgi:5-amino-6-(5-phosphoribosylamino)uracil reductase